MKVIFFYTSRCGDRVGENAPGSSSSFRFLVFWELFLHHLHHWCLNCFTTEIFNMLIQKCPQLLANCDHNKMSSMQGADKQAVWP